MPASQDGRQPSKVEHQSKKMKEEMTARQEAMIQSNQKRMEVN
jgi:hypothetical protein